MSEKTVCPFCKEKVSPEARKCPHCLMPIPENPIHGGTCPICKEAIDPQATRCLHCKSWVSGSQAAPPELPRPVYRVSNQLLASLLSAILGDKFDDDEYLTIPPPPPPPSPAPVFCVNEEIHDPQRARVLIVRKCYDRETGKLVSERTVGSYSLLDPTAR